MDQMLIMDKKRTEDVDFCRIDGKTPKEWAKEVGEKRDADYPSVKFHSKDWSESASPWETGSPDADG